MHFHLPGAACYIGKLSTCVVILHTSEGQWPSRESVEPNLRKYHPRKMSVHRKARTHSYLHINFSHFTFSVHDFSFAA